MGLLSKKQRKAQSIPRRRATASGGGTSGATDTRFAFRRNQTITGSLVSNLRSATEPSSQLKSPRVQVHELKKHRRKLQWSLVLIGGCMIVSAWLITEFIVTSRVVVAESARPNASTDAYEKSIERYMAHHPTSRLRFLMDTEQLSQFMQNNGHPEIASVSDNIESPELTVKQFTLHVRRPAVVWRTGSAELFVDAEGVAFSRNAHGRPDVEVVDESGIQAKNNQVLASERFLGFIGLTVGAMNSYDYTVERIVLPANTTRQVQIYVTGVPYPIKFSVDRGAGEQAEDAHRAIRHLSRAGVTPEYLDVRVKGKAYYK